MRFALGSLALYVGQLGQEDSNTLLTSVFNKMLSGDANDEVKAFFLYHLAFFGGAEAISAIRYDIYKILTTNFKTIGQNLVARVKVGIFTN